MADDLTKDVPILVTGANGALGNELQDYFESTGIKAIYTSRQGNSERCLDVTDSQQVGACLNRFKPRLLYHLAAIVPIPLVEQDNAGALNLNVGGLGNICRSIQSLGLSCRVVITSSSEVYGNGTISEKFHESDHFSPSNYYAFTKVAQEELSSLYRKQGLDIRVARIFNYSSIYKKPIYSLESFASQIAKLMHGGLEPVIHVGSLEPERDFLQGRDVAAALERIGFARSEHDVFNVSRGSTVTMRTLLQLIVDRFGANVEIKIDTQRLRNIENMFVCGDNTRLQTLGWKPSISIEEMVEILVDSYKNEPIVGKV